MRSETSFWLNIPKVAEAGFKHSSTDHKAMAFVIGGAVILTGTFAIAVHKSERFSDLASKVVDGYTSNPKEPFHQKAQPQNGKAHDHVQPDADIPVCEPV